MVFNICNACSLFTASELNGLSKELNIQLMNDGQTPESKQITDCLLIFALMFMTVKCLVLLD